MKETKKQRLWEVDNIPKDITSRYDYTGIVIHHADFFTRENRHLAFDIDDWHINQGWAGIGYAYVVERDGTIYKTFRAQEERQQAHCKGHSPDGKYTYNKDFLGICLSMDGAQQEISPDQRKSLLELIYNLGINNPINKGMLFSHALLQGDKKCPGYHVAKEFHLMHKRLEDAVEAR